MDKRKCARSILRAAGLPVGALEPFASGSRSHRPLTKSGRTVVFLSLEDETGLVNVIVFEDVYQKYGHLLFGPQVGPLRVAGILQHRGVEVSRPASGSLRDARPCSPWPDAQ